MPSKAAFGSPHVTAILCKEPQRIHLAIKIMHNCDSGLACDESLRIMRYALHAMHFQAGDLRCFMSECRCAQHLLLRKARYGVCTCVQQEFK